MEIKKEIIVIDWTNKSAKGNFLNLTLTSDERKIIRGRKMTDCNRSLLMQLPRKASLSDGDILITNHKGILIKVFARSEKLIQINSKSKLNLLKISYHLGNRHIEMEISKNNLLIKDDHVIKNLLNNFEVEIVKVKKKFFPEPGAFHHEAK